MNLSEKMEEWGILQAQADVLREAIEKEVIALGATQRVGKVVAEYRKSATNGSYNYEGMVRRMNASHDVILSYTVTPEPYVEWKKLAEFLEVPTDIRDSFYTEAEGKPKVTVKFSK